MRGGADWCYNRIGIGGDATCERLAYVGHCRNCEEYSRAGRALLDREADEPLRQEWRATLAEPKPAAAERGESAVVFRVRDEYLALPTAMVERISDVRPIHSVPGHTGGALIGIVSIDGELLPCFSAAAALQVECAEAPSGGGRLLVLHNAGLRLVCGVDEVTGVMRLNPADLDEPPVTLSRNARVFTTAVFRLKDKRGGLLDGERFLQSLIGSATV